MLPGKGIRSCVGSWSPRQFCWDSKWAPHVQGDSHGEEQGNHLAWAQRWRLVSNSPGFKPSDFVPMSMLVLSNDYRIKILIINLRLAKLRPRSLRGECCDCGASHLCKPDGIDDSPCGIICQFLLTVPTCPVMWNSTLLAPEKNLTWRRCCKRSSKVMIETHGKCFFHNPMGFFAIFLSDKLFNHLYWRI